MLFKYVLNVAFWKLNVCFCKCSKPGSLCMNHQLLKWGGGAPATCLLLRIDGHWQKSAGLAVGGNLLMTDCRSLVCSSSTQLLLLMAVLSPQLSGAESSFMGLLMLIKLQQCEVVGSNYKDSIAHTLLSVSERIGNWHQRQMEVFVWVCLFWFTFQHCSKSLMGWKMEMPLTTQ